MITEKSKKSIFDLGQQLETEGTRREQSMEQLTEAVERELNRVYAEIDRQKQAR